MNTWMKTKIQALRSHLVFRLWAMMMVLVFLAIGFMWVAQIGLFEQTYAMASLKDTRERTAGILESLAEEDIGKDPHLLSFLSHGNSELFLISQEGRLLEMYSAGHPVSSTDRREEFFRNLLPGEKNEQSFLAIDQPYQQVLRQGRHVMGYEMGFPVTWNGEKCILLIRTILMTKPVMDFNRRQLIVLTILLTLTASLLAAVFSRHFTRPIGQIRDSVERLTKNDFTEVPPFHREDELGQLSQSVVQLRYALQRLDVLRKEVIANVSHELRSPLALIGGYAEMVRDITWKQEEQRTEDLNLIIREANRMSHMVSDILDYSQLQAGYCQLKKERLNLCELLESAIAWYQPLAQEHHITLELEYIQEELLTEADASKMNQVIRNLLNNAINHTADGECIRVTADSCRISIANPGPPISEEDRKIIWERYQRSQHQSGRRLGTGIGLSIVSTILEAHHLAYGVDCQDGWNIFWFSYQSARQ